MLKFRKASQHKECNTCHNLREKLHGKKGNAKQKMELAETGVNICVPNITIGSSTGAFGGHQASLDVLTIIIDGMDQVKTAWPQYKFPRKSHALENLKRPRVILTAVLCHGWCTNVYITDEFLHHGASSFCELISRSLDNVAGIAEKQGRAFPRHLVIQADNTTAQNKNSLVSLFLAHLVSEGKFLTCTLNFLTVIHTHEDVDHFFSLILSTVLRPCRFQVPEELMALLKSKGSLCVFRG